MEKLTIISLDFDNAFQPPNKKRIKRLTRVFQAIRMMYNKEKTSKNPLDYIKE